MTWTRDLDPADEPITDRFPRCGLCPHEEHGLTCHVQIAVRHPWGTVRQACGCGGPWVGRVAS